MFADYAFPSTVVLLKFILKLALEDRVNKVDTAKALLGFPIDLAYLAISFLAVILSHVQANGEHHASVRLALAIFVAYVAGAALVTIFSKKSERAFIEEKNLKSFGLIVPAYLIAIFGAVLSLQVGVLI